MEFISRVRSLNGLTYRMHCFLLRAYLFFPSFFYFPCQAFVFFILRRSFHRFSDVAPHIQIRTIRSICFRWRGSYVTVGESFVPNFFAIYSAASIKIVVLFAFLVNIRFFMENHRTFSRCSRVITEITGNWTQDCVDRREKWRNERLAHLFFNSCPYISGRIIKI